ncbi:hypothetical protein BH11PAT1_BH11PAT1_0330 [soil metagenome]
MNNNNKTLALIIGTVVVFIIGIIIVSFFNLIPGSMKKGKVTIHGKTYTVEVAKTQTQQEKGLSHRSSLSEDKGMLFLFTSKDFPRFWMKDTKIPLDIIFISDNKVVTIFPNVPYPASSEENTNPPTYMPTDPADKVLELKGGTAEKYSIKQGDNVEITL